MFVPDLSSESGAGHSLDVLRTYISALRLIAGWWLVIGTLASCSSYDSADNRGLGGRAPVVSGPNWRPWVMGGQTGALTPLPCGLTPAAAEGDSIPGGDSGFVINTESCVNFSAAELELHDEDGMMVAFDLEPLPDGAFLVRPRSPLPAGVYSLTIAGMKMEPVIAEAPAEVPMRLGSLRALDLGCGAGAELTVDPLVLEFLPQLKLSVSVDGAPEQVWFDYGALDVEDGRAKLSLRDCFPSCLGNGPHTMRVTAELAGETGTLEPIDVAFETECQPAGPSDEEEGGACSVAPGGRRSAGGAMFAAWLLVLVGLLLGRRSRSSCGPGIEPP